MAQIHNLLLTKGKEAAIQSDIARSVVEAAVGYMSSEDTDIGYFFSGWAQAALPHRRLPDDQAWQVTTDRATLIVQPGLLPNPDGQPISVGVPYGSRARLILLYLQTEAVRTNSRQIELGRSLHAWLRRLEIPIGGKQMTSVRDQAERISRCRLSFQIKQGDRTGLMNQHILDTRTHKVACLLRQLACRSRFLMNSRNIQCLWKKLQFAKSPITHWPSMSIVGWPTASTVLTIRLPFHGRHCTPNLVVQWPGWTTSRITSARS